MAFKAFLKFIYYKYQYRNTDYRLPATDLLKILPDTW